MYRFLNFPLLFLACMACLLQSCQGSRDEDSGGKPNFVWIVSEDNSTHYMELFDPNGIGTPNIEAMAAHGLCFDRAFSNAPVCSVARSTLISSCYGPRTGAQYHRKLKLVPMPDGVEMFPASLRQAGYYTTNRKKEDYNYVKDEDVWDESSGEAHWRNRSAGQPFFHMASYANSHESRLHFPESLVHQYHPVTDPSNVHVFPVHPDTELFRFTAAYYRDKILEIDSIVGQVVQELEEDGLLENTFIFYFGDHGGVLPGSKAYVWESGLHIPLVVRIPEKFRHLVDFEPGSRTDGFVSFVDFGPTLLELAGAGMPEGIDGKPFLGPGIPATELEKWDVSYGYADRFDEKYDMVRTIRKGKYKYMRSYQPFNFDALQNNYRYKCLAYEQWRQMYRAGELDPVQAAFFEARAPEALYDLEEDPYETRNLAADTAYRGVLEELRGRMSGWVKGMPDLSFYPESKLVAEAFGNPIAYGQEHREQIATMVDIADLSLLPYEKARPGIEAALSSDDPMYLYWGLIVCSNFGEQALEFEAKARELYGHDDLLVRSRAAEFLGLAGLADPVPLMLETLAASEDPVEVLIMLNSLVLMVDGPRAYSLNFAELELAEEIASDYLVQQRLEYLSKR